ncbi:uncharacterized protein LOC130750104 [Actinidia eriantha]|uniref:uncharacterized protein LOC130750104 n=1 Tax=Actinidia eriantha TaxID=165200 RepID=UPI00258F825E|nr:uncharacterized protein LOC130750104 [Actinidia eriantha]
MEEIHEAAMARYENLFEDQKAEVKDLFTKMDSDGDGKVSLQEYLDHPKKDGYDQEMFELVDKDGDGYWDFDEFKTFEFIYKVRGFLICEGCSCYLWGTYYACLTCYDAGNDAFGYNLCCSCYRNKSFQHDHTDFRDNHRICQLRRPKRSQRNASKPVNRANPRTIIKDGEREMEEMHNAAMAYYENLTEEQKQQARKLYELSDTNGDGTVSLEEFLDFLSEQNFSEYVPPNLFKLLDKNRDGTIDFEEFVTLYYIVKVCRGIITCDGCGGNLWGNIYFLCVECYYAGGRTYDLCCKCYHNKRFKHVHTAFLDSYVLLDRMQPKQLDRMQPKQQTQNAPTQGNITSRKGQGGRSNAQTGNTSKKGQVKRSNTKMERVRTAFELWEAGVVIGQTAFIASTMCTVM